jgi:hypothetical protein
MRIFSMDIEWYVLVMLLAVFLVFSAASAADREQVDHRASAQQYIEVPIPVLDSENTSYVPSMPGRGSA